MTVVGGIEFEATLDTSALEKSIKAMETRNFKGVTVPVSFDTTKGIQQLQKDLLNADLCIPLKFCDDSITKELARVKKAFNLNLARHTVSINANTADFDKQLAQLTKSNYNATVNVNSNTENASQQIEKLVSKSYDLSVAVKGVFSEFTTTLNSLLTQARSIYVDVEHNTDEFAKELNELLKKPRDIVIGLIRQSEVFEQQLHTLLSTPRNIIVGVEKEAEKFERELNELLKIPRAITVEVKKEAEKFNKELNALLNTPRNLIVDVRKNAESFTKELNSLLEIPRSIIVDIVKESNNFRNELNSLLNIPRSIIVEVVKESEKFNQELNALLTTPRNLIVDVRKNAESFKNELNSLLSVPRSIIVNVVKESNAFKNELNSLLSIPRSIIVDVVKESNAFKNELNSLLSVPRSIIVNVVKESNAFENELNSLLSIPRSIVVDVVKESEKFNKELKALLNTPRNIIVDVRKNAESFTNELNSLLSIPRSIVVDVVKESEKFKKELKDLLNTPRNLIVDVRKNAESFTKELTSLLDIPRSIVVDVVKESNAFKDELNSLLSIPRSIVVDVVKESSNFRSDLNALLSQQRSVFIDTILEPNVTKLQDTIREFASTPIDLLFKFKDGFANYTKIVTDISEAGRVFKDMGDYLKSGITNFGESFKASVAKFADNQKKSGGFFSGILKTTIAYIVASKFTGHHKPTTVRIDQDTPILVTVPPQQVPAATKVNTQSPTPIETVLPQMAEQLRIIQKGGNYEYQIPDNISPEAKAKIDSIIGESNLTTKVGDINVPVLPPKLVEKLIEANLANVIRKIYSASSTGLRHAGRDKGRVGADQLSQVQSQVASGEAVVYIAPKSDFASLSDELKELVVASGWHTASQIPQQSQWAVPGASQQPQKKTSSDLSQDINQIGDLFINLLAEMQARLASAVDDESVGVVASDDLEALGAVTTSNIAKKSGGIFQQILNSLNEEFEAEWSKKIQTILPPPVLKISEAVSDFSIMLMANIIGAFTNAEIGTINTKHFATNLQASINEILAVKKDENLNVFDNVVNNIKIKIADLISVLGKVLPILDGVLGVFHKWTVKDFVIPIPKFDADWNFEGFEYKVKNPNQETRNENRPLVSSKQEVMKHILKQVAEDIVNVFQEVNEKGVSDDSVFSKFPEVQDFNVSLIEKQSRIADFLASVLTRANPEWLVYTDDGETTIDVNATKENLKQHSSEIVQYQNNPDSLDEALKIAQSNFDVDEIDFKFFELLVDAFQSDIQAEGLPESIYSEMFDLSSLETVMLDNAQKLFKRVAQLISAERTDLLVFDKNENGKDSQLNLKATLENIESYLKEKSETLTDAGLFTDIADILNNPDAFKELNDSIENLNLALSSIGVYFSEDKDTTKQTDQRTLLTSDNEELTGRRLAIDSLEFRKKVESFQVDDSIIYRSSSGDNVETPPENIAITSSAIIDNLMPGAKKIDNEFLLKLSQKLADINFGGSIEFIESASGSSQDIQIISFDATEIENAEKILQDALKELGVIVPLFMRGGQFYYSNIDDSTGKVYAQSEQSWMVELLQRNDADEFYYTGATGELLFQNPHEPTPDLQKAITKQDVPIEEFSLQPQKQKKTIGLFQNYFLAYKEEIESNIQKALQSIFTLEPLTIEDLKSQVGNQEELQKEIERLEKLKSMPHIGKNVNLGTIAMGTALALVGRAVADLATIPEVKENIPFSVITNAVAMQMLGNYMQAREDVIAYRPPEILEAAMTEGARTKQQNTNRTRFVVDPRQSDFKAAFPAFDAEYADLLNPTVGGYEVSTQGDYAVDHYDLDPKNRFTTPLTLPFLDAVFQNPTLANALGAVIANNNPSTHTGFVPFTNIARFAQHQPEGSQTRKQYFVANNQAIASIGQPFMTMVPGLFGIHNNTTQNSHPTTIESQPSIFSSRTKLTDAPAIETVNKMLDAIAEMSGDVAQETLAKSRDALDASVPNLDIVIDDKFLKQHGYAALYQSGGAEKANRIIISSEAAKALQSRGGLSASGKQQLTFIAHEMRHAFQKQFGTISQNDMVANPELAQMGVGGLTRSDSAVDFLDQVKDVYDKAFANLPQNVKDLLISLEIDAYSFQENIDEILSKAGVDATVVENLVENPVETSENEFEKSRAETRQKVTAFYESIGNFISELTVNVSDKFNQLFTAISDSFSGLIQQAQNTILNTFGLLSGDTNNADNMAAVTTPSSMNADAQNPKIEKLFQAFSHLSKLLQVQALPVTKQILKALVITGELLLQIINTIKKIAAPFFTGEFSQITNAASAVYGVANESLQNSGVLQQLANAVQGLQNVATTVTTPQQTNTQSTQFPSRITRPEKSEDDTPFPETFDLEENVIGDFVDSVYEQVEETLQNTVNKILDNGGSLPEVLALPDSFEFSETDAEQPKQNFITKFNKFLDAVAENIAKPIQQRVNNDIDGDDTEINAAVSGQQNKLKKLVSAMIAVGNVIEKSGKWTLKQVGAVLQGTANSPTQVIPLAQNESAFWVRNLSTIFSAWGEGGAKVEDINQQISIWYENLQQQAPQIAGFLDNIRKSWSAYNTVGLAVSAWKGLKSLLPQGLDVAAEFQTFNIQLKIVLGTYDAAEKKIKNLRDLADRTGNDITAMIKNYAQLASSTKDTVLEGIETDSIIEAMAMAGAVYELSAEQFDNALLAITQMASKGIVSMEELRRQLGTHLPGAMQIAARAMKMTEKDFDRLVSSGSLMASEFLPLFAQQLKLELGGGVEDSVGGLINKRILFNNALTEFNKALGEAALPLESLRLDVISQLLDIITGQINNIGLVMTGGAIYAMIRLITSQLAQIPVVISIISGGVHVLMNVIKSYFMTIMLPLLKKLIIIYTVMTVGAKAFQAYKEATKDTQIQILSANWLKNIKDSKKRTEELRKEIEKIKDREIQIKANLKIDDDQWKGLQVTAFSTGHTEDFKSINENFKKAAEDYKKHYDKYGHDPYQNSNVFVRQIVRGVLNRLNRRVTPSETEAEQHLDQSQVKLRANLYGHPLAPAARLIITGFKWDDAVKLKTAIQADVDEEREAYRLERELARSGDTIRQRNLLGLGGYTSKEVKAEQDGALRQQFDEIDALINNANAISNIQAINQQLNEVRAKLGRAETRTSRDVLLAQRVSLVRDRDAEGSGEYEIALMKLNQGINYHEKLLDPQNENRIRNPILIRQTRNLIKNLQEQRDELQKIVAEMGGTQELTDILRGIAKSALLVENIDTMADKITKKSRVHFYMEMFNSNELTRNKAQIDAINKELESLNKELLETTKLLAADDIKAIALSTGVVSGTPLASLNQEQLRKELSETDSTNAQRIKTINLLIRQLTLEKEIALTIEKANKATQVKSDLVEEAIKLLKDDFSFGEDYIMPDNIAVLRQLITDTKMAVVELNLAKEKVKEIEKELLNLKGLFKDTDVYTRLSELDPLTGLRYADMSIPELNRAMQELDDTQNELKTALQGQIRIRELELSLIEAQSAEIDAMLQNETKIMELKLSMVSLRRQEMELANQLANAEVSMKIINSEFDSYGYETEQRRSIQNLNEVNQRIAITNEEREAIEKAYLDGIITVEKYYEESNRLKAESAQNGIDQAQAELDAKRAAERKFLEEFRKSHDEQSRIKARTHALTIRQIRQAQLAQQINPDAAAYAEAVADQRNESNLISIENRRRKINNAMVNNVISKEEGENALNELRDEYNQALISTADTDLRVANARIAKEAEERRSDLLDSQISGSGQLNLINPEDLRLKEAKLDLDSALTPIERQQKLIEYLNARIEAGRASQSQSLVGQQLSGGVTASSLSLLEAQIDYQSATSPLDQQRAWLAVLQAQRQVFIDEIAAETMQMQMADGISSELVAYREAWAQLKAPSLDPLERTANELAYYQAEIAYRLSLISEAIAKAEFEIESDSGKANLKIQEDKLNAIKRGAVDRTTLDREVNEASLKIEKSTIDRRLALAEKSLRDYKRANFATQQERVQTIRDAENQVLQLTQERIQKEIELEDAKTERILANYDKQISALQRSYDIINQNLDSFKSQVDDIGRLISEFTKLSDAQRGLIESLERFNLDQKQFAVDAINNRISLIQQLQDLNAKADSEEGLTEGEKYKQRVLRELAGVGGFGDFSGDIARNFNEGVRLELDLAKEKTQQLLRQEKIQQAQLELQIAANAIAAKTAEIEARIAHIKAQQEASQALMNFRRASASGDTEEIANAQNQLQLATQMLRLTGEGVTMAVLGSDISKMSDDLLRQNRFADAQSERQRINQENNQLVQDLKLRGADLAASGAIRPGQIRQVGKAPQLKVDNDGMARLSSGMDAIIQHISRMGAAGTMIADMVYKGLLSSESLEDIMRRIASGEQLSVGLLSELAQDTKKQQNRKENTIKPFNLNAAANALRSGDYELVARLFENTPGKGFGQKAEPPATDYDKLGLSDEFKERVAYAGGNMALLIASSIDNNAEMAAVRDSANTSAIVEGLMAVRDAILGSRDADGNLTPGGFNFSGMQDSVARALSYQELFNTPSAGNINYDAIEQRNGQTLTENHTQTNELLRTIALNTSRNENSGTVNLTVVSNNPMGDATRLYEDIANLQRG